MINEVMGSIADAIEGTFGNDCLICKEETELGSGAPVFFIRCRNPGIERLPGERKKMTLLFSVQYLPASQTPNQEMNTVFEKLYDCLELIEAEGRKIRGHLTCEDISGDGLVVMAEYVLFLNQKETENYMENYQMKGELKNGDRN